MAKNIDIKDVKEQVATYLLGFKKILQFIAAHAFAVILALVVIDIMFGAFLFYKNVVLRENEKPVIDSASFQFKEESYNKILNQWIAKDEGLEKFLEKSYKDPFR